LGKIQQAKADYNQAAKIKPNDYEIYYYRGGLYSFILDYSAAIYDFSKAIELNPNFADSYKERALIYEKKGEKVKADADNKKFENLNGKP